MAVPQVSHKNWWRTKANAQVAMGNHQVDAQELAFNTCLELLLTENATYRGMASEHSKDRSVTHSHPDWERGVTVVRDYGDRERHHRPSVDSDVLSRFEEQVAEEWPNIPTEDLSFDRKLSLLLEIREKWLDGLTNSVGMKNEATEEVVELD